jgi:hypothetical protein
MLALKLSVEKVMMAFTTILALKLVGICAIPECYRFHCGRGAFPADQFLFFWTPIEPAEMMLFATLGTFKPSMPCTSKDIVLECIDTIPEWILIL